MAKQAAVVPVPEAGADGGDDGDQLFALLSAAQGKPLPEPPKKAPVEDTPEETASEESETPETASEEPSAEEVPDEETPEEEQVEAEPTLHDVVINGKTEKVSLDEALAGYSRTADYTRKTQALAQKAAEVAARERDIGQDRERYIQGLKDVEALLTQGDTEPDWTQLAEELDPADYNRQRAQWDAKHRLATTLRTKREAEQQKAFADQQKQYEAYLAAENAKLLQAVPEWKDTTKAQADYAKIVAYALKDGADDGITEQHIAKLDSAFALRQLRKAMLYDELMAAKPKVVKQKTPTPTPMAKPGAATPKTKRDPAAEAMARLTGTHTDADELAFIEHAFLPKETRSPR